MDLAIVKPDGTEEKSTLENVLKSAEKTLIYFYPKDNTSGCSLQAVDFSSFLGEFKQKGVQIIGVSKDSIKSHIGFIDKKNIQFPLISDPELRLHKKFGTFGEKKMYGKVTMGTIRSSFLLDSKGNILKEWRNVRAKGHVEKILDSI